MFVKKSAGHSPLVLQRLALKTTAQEKKVNDGEDHQVNNLAGTKEDIYSGQEDIANLFSEGQRPLPYVPAIPLSSYPPGCPRTLLFPLELEQLGFYWDQTTDKIRALGKNGADDLGMFQYNVSLEQSYNDARWHAVCYSVKLLVEQELIGLRFETIHLGQSDGHVHQGINTGVSILASENIFRAKSIVALLPTTPTTSAGLGVWNRRVLLTDGVSKGSMLEIVKNIWAKNPEIGILIMNPTELARTRVQLPRNVIDNMHWSKAESQLDEAAVRWSRVVLRERLTKIDFVSSRPRATVINQFIDTAIPGHADPTEHAIKVIDWLIANLPTLSKISFVADQRASHYLIAALTASNERLLKQLSGRIGPIAFVGAGHLIKNVPIATAQLFWNNAVNWSTRRVGANDEGPGHLEPGLGCITITIPNPSGDNDLLLSLAMDSIVEHITSIHEGGLVTSEAQDKLLAATEEEERLQMEALLEENHFQQEQSSRSDEKKRMEEQLGPGERLSEDGWGNPIIVKAA